ncbi:MAG TPA: nuclear transport factor 2 family protein, partial [Thermoleophilaceae bacterium]|nr:nuclear transport factor 2 family protein [Thermoleophilaceae bacterium]
FDNFRADVEDIVQRGEYVIAAVVLRGRLRGSGEEVQLAEIHVWRLRDGLAVEVREYRTLDQALDAVGRAEP